MPTAPLMIEPQAILRRLLRIEGVHNYGPADLLVAVNFINDFGATYPLESLSADQFGLAEVDAAFARGRDLPGQRVVVIPAMDRQGSITPPSVTLFGTRQSSSYRFQGRDQLILQIGNSRTGSKRFMTSSNTAYFVRGSWCSI